MAVIVLLLETYGRPEVRIFISIGSQLTFFPEYILGSIVNYAKELLKPYEDPTLTPPDPSFVLQLPNEVLTGSNLYAVQKIYQGPFQFDVFFESSSAKQKLSCSSSTTSLLESS